MNKVYEDDFVTLYCGDCLQLRRSEVAADAMMTDPPYDDETHAGARSDLRPDYGVGFAALTSKEFGYIVTRAFARWHLSFCALEMLGTYRAHVGDRWVRAGIWDRVGGAPQFSGDRPAQAAEGIAIWHGDAKKQWNGGGRHAKWTHPIVRGEERVHETQKPLSLMRELVLDFTLPGETIFDPFAGSGTTGVAAKICGRRAILVELSHERCQHAIHRLAAAEVDERIASVGEVKKARQSALKWSE